MKRKFALCLCLLTIAFAASSASAELVTSADASFDMRGTGLIPSEIRDQSPRGLCWAFGALSSVESNYMWQVSFDEKPVVSALEPDADPQLNPHASELYLGWFSRYDPDPKRAYRVFSVVSGDKDLMSLDYLRNHPGSVLTGGFWTVPAAMMTRGFGPIPHSEMPYSLAKYVSDLATLVDKRPEDYTTVLWVTDISHLEYPDPNSANAESLRATVIKDVKDLVSKGGAVAITYTDTDDSRNAQWKTYYCTSEDTARAVKNNPKASAGHVVGVVGWDDDFPAESFDVQNRTRPDIKGAWLIRNSWGKAAEHDNGYFWMSYQQQATFEAYTVESADSRIVCYDWDPLGWCSRWGGESTDVYAVNVFKTGNQPVSLERIGFYTCAPEDTVTLYVNNTYGTTKPTESTVSLGTAVQTKEYYYYSGYHTYALSGDQNFVIPANSYFSVAMKVDQKTNQSSHIAVEARLKGYSDYAQVFDGESFFSADGSSWTDGTKITYTDDKTNETSVYPMNACIKAFVMSTTGTATEPQPEPTSEEQTIDGKTWSERPANTVSDARLMEVNNPSGENAADLTGRSLSVYLLGNDGQYLTEGTQATLNFLFIGTGASYDLYYVDNDNDDNADEDGQYHGYSERPGEEWARELYPVGCEPHSYVDDEGELFADYVKTVTVGANGLVALNADDIATASEGKSIPSAYYDVFYTLSNDSIVGTLPIINITDSDDKKDDDPDDDDKPYGVSSNSSGCSLGLGGMVLLAGLTVLLKKR